ncbi:hypothetical protein D3C75_1039780 [compost metagenome]
MDRICVQLSCTAWNIPAPRRVLRIVRPAVPGLLKQAFHLYIQRFDPFQRSRCLLQIVLLLFLISGLSAGNLLKHFSGFL